MSYHEFNSFKTTLPGAKKETDEDYDPYDEGWGNSFYKEERPPVPGKDHLLDQVIGDRTARDLKVEAMNPEHILMPTSADLADKIKDFSGDSLSLFLASNFDLHDNVNKYEEALLNFAHEDSKYKTPLGSYYPEYQKQQAQEQQKKEESVRDNVFTQPNNEQMAR